MLPRVFALWLLPRYSAGALRGWAGRAVRRAIDSDDVVAAAYDALRAAEARPHGGLSGAQKDLLLGAVLDDVAALDAAAVPDGVGARVAPRRTALRRFAPFAPFAPFAAPFAAAVACVGLFVVVDRPGISGADGGWGVRGGSGDGPLGVRVRCVDHGAVVDEASAGARQTGTDLECGAGSLLAFSTTNLQPDTRYAFVIGVADDDSRVWLPPFTRDSAARPLAAGVANDVVDTLAPVPRASAAPAHLTLFVLLDDAPFTGADVERRLAAAARNGVPLARLDKLPVDVFAQGRLVLRAPR